MNQALRWNAFLAEGLGTFLFFFIGMGAGYAASGEGGSVAVLLIALAHGIALAVMVSALGAISGGHFNPAVTFGLWIAGKIEPVTGAIYVVVQLVAAVIAAAVALYVFSDRPGIEAPMVVPALGEGIDIVRGIVVEAVLTMGLLLAVFGTAVDRRGPKIGGLAIGLAVAAGILMAATVSGGAMNPARWFGAAVVASDYVNAVVWIVGPLLGAGIVALIYRIRYLPEADAEERPAE